MIFRAVKVLAAVLLGAAIAFACFAPEPLLLRARAYLPAVKVRVSRVAPPHPLMVPAEVRMDPELVALSAHRVQRIAIVGLLGESTSRELGEALKIAENNGATDLEILIDSHGGNIGVGFGMTSLIAETKILTHCLVGHVAESSAFLLLQGCDDRAALASSRLMAHHPFMYLPAGVVFSAEGLKMAADSLFQSRALLIETLAVKSLEKLGAAADEIALRLGEGDWVMSPTEAVAFGFLDRVVADGATFQASVER